MFSSTRPTRKWDHFAYRFQNEHGAFGVEDPHLYRVRRMALNPFFSRRKIVEYTPKLQQNMNKLLHRLREEYVGKDQMLNATAMWECFAADGVAGYAFKQSYNFLDSPGFHSEMNEAITNMTELALWFWNFRFLAQSIRVLPKKLVAVLNPGMVPLFKFYEAQESQIAKLLEKHDAGEKFDDNSLFSSLLEQDIAKHDITKIRFEQEAKSVVGAGSETVARTLQLATFHILDNPNVREKLTTELATAVPDPNNAFPDYDTLTRLPYLSACVEESLRLTYGLGERRARAYDGGVLQYGDYAIPPGTFVSMDNYDVSHDEVIFPASYAFVPERWLDDPKAPDGKHLGRYMVSFGKGMRNCVGFQLAYAEISIGVANFFRADFVRNAKLVETSKRDLEMARERFVPRPPKDSKGVRIVLG